MFAAMKGGGKHEPAKRDELHGVPATVPDRRSLRSIFASAALAGGFVCPKCGGTGCYQLRGRREYVCKHCHRKSSVTAGTVLHRTHLPLTIWFWAIYLVARDKRGISEVQLSHELRNLDFIRLTVYNYTDRAWRSRKT